MILAYAGWNYAVSRLGAARTGGFSHLLPAFGVIFAALFLGEYPRLVPLRRHRADRRRHRAFLAQSFIGFQ